MSYWPSAFFALPYIAPGARLGDLLAPAILILVMPMLAVQWPRWAVPARLLAVGGFLLLVGAIVTAAFSTVSLEALSISSGNNRYSAVVGLLRVLSVFCFTYLVLRRSDAASGRATRTASLTVHLLAMNAVLAFAQSLGALEVWLSKFFWDGSNEDNVGIRAAAQGRYSGIFNQPLEAGFGYGVAAILAVWLLLRGEYSPRRTAAMLAVVTLGCALSLTKTGFLGIGVAITWLIVRRLRKRQDALGAGKLLKFGFTLGLLAVAGAVVVDPAILDQVRQLAIGAVRGDTELITAGRGAVGSSSLTRLALDSVVSSGGLVGGGVHNTSSALDNGYMDAVIASGLVWALGACVCALSAWRSAPRSLERAALGALLVYVALASLGGPVVRSARGGDVMACALACVVAVAASGPRSSSSVVGGIGLRAPGAWRNEAPRV